MLLQQVRGKNKGLKGNRGSKGEHVIFLKLLSMTQTNPVLFTSIKFLKEVITVKWSKA